MSHTHKSFALNASIQDFKNKGTFQSKDEILARVKFNAEVHQELENSDFDDLTFSKKQTDNDSDLIDRIKSLKERVAASFDFANEYAINQELSHLENQKRQLDQDDRTETRKEMLISISGILAKTIGYSCMAILIWIVFQAWPKSNETQAKSSPQVTVEATKQLDSQPQAAPISKEQFNAMLLDGIAKQMATSTKEFSEQTPPAAIEQVSRIGQMVLELAHNNNKGDKK